MQAKPTGSKLILRSLEFVRPYRRTLIAVTALALFLAALSAVDPLLMKYLFDQLGAGTAVGKFTAAMAGLVVLEIARAALQAWLGVRSWDVRLGVDYTVRERVMGQRN